MTTDPRKLSLKLVEYIVTNPGCTYTTINTRATAHGISPDILEQALTIVHKNKLIQTKVIGGDIVYSIAVEKTKTLPGGKEWVTANYPKMDETNNGSGIEADFSYLFLTPEELLEYKAKVKGVAYLPKKRYANP